MMNSEQSEWKRPQYNLKHQTSVLLEEVEKSTTCEKLYMKIFVEN